MRQTIQFVLLLLAGAILASAQNTIPVNPATIDYLTIVTQQLDNMLLSGIPVLVNLGLNIVNGFGLTIFLLLMIRWTYQHFAHHHVHFNVYPLLAFFFLIAFVDTLLYYYANPLPGLGVGLARFPSEVARHISGFLDLQVYNALLERVHNLTVNLQQPTGLFDFMGMLRLRLCLYQYSVPGFRSVPGDHFRLYFLRAHGAGGSDLYFVPALSGAQTVFPFLAQHVTPLCFLPHCRLCPGVHLGERHDYGH
jgi:hypothetical protein